MTMNRRTLLSRFAAIAAAVAVAPAVKAEATPVDPWLLDYRDSGQFDRDMHTLAAVRVTGSDESNRSNFVGYNEPVLFLNSERSSTAGTLRLPNNAPVAARSANETLRSLIETLEVNGLMRGDMT